MRPYLTLALMGLSLALSLSVAPQANAISLVGSWDFNSLTNPGNNSPSNANVTVYAPDAGTGTLTLARVNSSATGGITNLAGSTINALNASPAGRALVIQGNATGDGATAATNNGATVTILVNLVNFIDPILTFASQKSSNTGFDSNQVSYSTNGTTFINFQSPFNPPGGSFALQTFNFSAINVLDGRSTVFFRINLAGATNGAGNIRLDNIQLNANAVPEPLTTAGLFLFGGLVATQRKRVSKK
jgi:hypothetical protein